jgi:hypothetical protein
VIEQILPAVAVSEEAFEDPPGLVLFPEEEALVARAVDKRRREFRTARACARTALAALGVAPAPLLPDAAGAVAPAALAEQVGPLPPRRPHRHQRGDRPHEPLPRTHKALAQRFIDRQDDYLPLHPRLPRPIRRRRLLDIRVVKPPDTTTAEY